MRLNALKKPVGAPDSETAFLRAPYGDPMTLDSYSQAYHGHDIADRHHDERAGSVVRSPPTLL